MCLQRWCLCIWLLLQRCRFNVMGCCVLTAHCKAISLTRRSAVVPAVLCCMLYRAASSVG